MGKRVERDSTCGGLNEVQIQWDSNYVQGCLHRLKGLSARNGAQQGSLCILVAIDHDRFLPRTSIQKRVQVIRGKLHSERGNTTMDGMNCRGYYQRRISPDEFWC